ncbi:MAG: outer membrane beta-barrel protein [Spirochaetia bacterium]|jgi:hypothetical protein|nr:outer membrane beta-barrel protein [Spirochaetia bacterium]
MEPHAAAGGLRLQNFHAITQVYAFIAIDNKIFLMVILLLARMKFLVNKNFMVLEEIQMKKILCVLCVSLAAVAWLPAYEEGDIPIEFEVGIGTSWGKAEGASSDYGYELEVGGKVGYFFNPYIGIMGGLSLDYFYTPYEIEYSEQDNLGNILEDSSMFDVSAVCLTIPVGIYLSPSGGFIFGGGFSLSVPVINLSEDYDSGEEIKLDPFTNFFVDGGYDFGESSGSGFKLLLRYSKSLTSIAADGDISKDFFHVMLGYSYITY